jgi:hypothetical protein
MRFSATLILFALSAAFAFPVGSILEQDSIAVRAPGSPGPLLRAKSIGDSSPAKKSGWSSVFTWRWVNVVDSRDGREAGFKWIWVWFRDCTLTCGIMHYWFHDIMDHLNIRIVIHLNWGYLRGVIQLVEHYA